MKRLIFPTILLLSIFLSAWQPAGAMPPAALPIPQQALFEQVSVEDGLSQSNVYAILQDRQGFLWFGTGDGLNRYDGYTFEIFRNDPDDPSSLRSNSIQTLYEDRDGNLWVGTIEGLDRFDAQSQTFVHYDDFLLEDESVYSNAVHAITEDKAGQFWLGTASRGLVRLDRQTGQFFHYTTRLDDEQSISTNTVTSLAVDGSGLLWVGTTHGLNRFDPESGVFTRYLTDPAEPGSLSSNQVRGVLADTSGGLWVATEDGGLNYLPPDQLAFQRFPVAGDNPTSLSSFTVRALLQDSSGRLWIGTRRGLDVFDPLENRFVHFHHDANNPNTIANDTVLSLYEDNSGVLWVGTFGGGLSKWNRYANKFTLYRHSPGGGSSSLSDDMVLSIFEDLDGVLWVGTMDGGLNRIDRGTGEVKIYRLNPEDEHSLSSNEVSDILRDRSGNLWVATAGGGLNLFNPRTERFSHFRHESTLPQSLSDNNVTILFEDAENNLWVGTQFGGLNLLERRAQTFEHYQYDSTNPASLSDNHIRALLEDDEGYIWVGTASGLNRMHPVSRRAERFRHRPQNPSSLSSDNVTAIFQDSNKALWIGTVLGGLNRFDWENETFRHYTTRDGLPNDTVYGILEDDQGYLWLSTNKGLSRFDPRTETFRNYDVHDGLQSNEFNSGAYYRGASGEIFFGGVRGLNAFHPEQLATNPNPPPIVITSYKAFNQTQQRNLITGDAIELPYSTNFISFEFVALDYNAPAKNQYMYMLEGFDQDWVFAGDRRYVNYTNLRGGDYTFRVRGSNNDGIWNESGVSIAIHVIPPFWQHWWFIASVAVVLGAAVWGGYYLRVKSVEGHNRQLEQQVRERTQEIERRRQVAEGLRDIIAILNSNRSLQDSLEFIITEIVQLMGAESAVLFEGGPRHGVQVIATNLPGGSPVRPEALLPGWVIRRLMNNQAVAVGNLEQYQKSRPEAAEFPIHGQCAVLAVPMSSESSVDGGLVLVFRESQSFSDEDMKTGYTFADQAALAIANARLRARAEELAVSAERSRLARDLHDAVTQTLFATSILAEVLPRIWERDPDEGKRRLMEVRELTRGALAEMRTLLMELRPAALLDADMDDLLEQLCDAFRGRARIPVRLAVDENIRLPGEAQVVFYRVAQEALNNIAKHARAGKAELELRLQDGQVQMLVADDGDGFDCEQHRPDHFGLSIMRERSESIGATLEISSESGSGTVIRLRWPLPPAPVEKTEAREAQAAD